MATTYSGGTTSTPVASSTGYPVSVTFERQPSYSRLYAIPFLGIFIKEIILIPHLIALGVVGLINAVMHLVAWFSVLTRGTYPEWAYNWTTGTIRWGVRVFAFLLGLTDKYPPFGLGSNDDGYPVQVAFQYPANPGKLYAIPLLGYAIRYVLLIPHLIVLEVLVFVVYILNIVTWIPVLFGGQYPEWGESMCGGALRWGARIAAYLYGLTDQYPPFALGN